MSNRRTFLKQGFLSIGATVTASPFLMAKDKTYSQNTAKISIKEHDVILFQGDSITDHGRARDIPNANNIDAMGRGYAMVAGSTLLNEHSNKNIKVYNKGISGNKVPELLARWDEDCIALKPNILSILIGVNDYWHKRNGNYDGSAESYRDQYRQLLDKTLRELPHVKLIIGEPFGVKNVKHVDDSWFPEFAAYQKVAKDIAEEYKAVFIPYQKIFDQAEKSASGDYWTTDGVHTSLAGVNLMAEHWLKTIR